MDLNDYLLQYAVESGAIVPEDDIDEQIDDSMVEYAIESCYRDLRTTLNLMSSLETLSSEVCESGANFTSFEAYERRVEDLLSVAGITIPVKVLVPSFEAESKEPGTVTERIKKAGSAFWQAIVSAFRRLKDFLLRLIGRSKEKTEKLEEKAEGFAEDLKSQGITHITNPKPTGALVKTHAHSASAVPKAFLDGKTWSKTKIETLSNDVKAALGKVDKATTKELLDAKIEFEKKYIFRNADDEKEWTASISDLEDAKKICFDLLERIRIIFRPIGEELDSMIEKAVKMEKENAKGKEVDDIKEAITRHKAAMGLFTALNRVDSLGWVVVGIVNHAKVVKDD